jgi:Arc/MetJ family transcription regulator
MAHMHVLMDDDLAARAKAAAALSKPKRTLSRLVADLLRAHLDGTASDRSPLGSAQANRTGGSEDRHRSAPRQGSSGLIIPRPPRTSADAPRTSVRCRAGVAKVNSVKK